MEDNLKLLSGKPLYVKELKMKMYQPTLDDISEIGEDEMYRTISYMLVSNLDVARNLDPTLAAEVSKMSNFSLLMASCMNEPQVSEKVMEILKILFRKPIKANLQFGMICVGDFKNKSSDEILIINEDNYSIVTRYLRILFALAPENPQEEKSQYRPANARAAAIAEKLNKGKKKVEEIKKNKAKKDNGETTSLFELVSVFCTASNTNILDVWSLTLFQFYDQLKRMNLYLQYNVSVNAAVHGADVEIANWMKRMD